MKDNKLKIKIYYDITMIWADKKEDITMLWRLIVFTVVFRFFFSFSFPQFSFLQKIVNAVCCKSHFLVGEVSVLVL